MKTADLIAALEADETVVPVRSIVRQIVMASFAGAGFAAVVVVFGLGLRPMGDAVHSRMFWMKALYTAVLAVAGCLASARLARPGSTAGWAPLLAILAIVFMITMGGVDLFRAEGPGMAREWLGTSWRVCPWYILGLAAPVYLAIVWVLRRMAPTNLGLAGAAAGLLAGGVAGTVYGLHCAENGAAFVATWYTLGVAAATGLGGLFGPRLLRW